MNQIFANQQSWTSLVAIALGLLGLYFVLLFAVTLLKRFRPFGRWQDRLRSGLHYLLLVYEPLAIVILCSIFVLINPVVHGLILLLLMISGFDFIKNYMNGRLVHADKNLTEGTSIRTNGEEGIITSMDRLGLHLQSRNGRHYISYAKLMANGYTLVSGDEIGGLFHLKLSPAESAAGQSHLVKLMDRLSMTPYIDWNHKPELQLIEKSDGPYLDARLLLKDDSHLQDLIALLKEWGYAPGLID